MTIGADVGAFDGQQLLFALEFGSNYQGSIAFIVHARLASRVLEPELVGLRRSVGEHVCERLSRIRVNDDVRPRRQKAIFFLQESMTHKGSVIATGLSHSNITKMRNRSIIVDEVEDIFASSDSEPSLSDGDRDSDEDFIAEDDEPTSALDPQEQLKIDKDIYARAHMEGVPQLEPTEKAKASTKRGSKTLLSERSPSSVKGRGKSVVPKEIGHSSFPLNSFSFTISKIKGDVDPSLLDGVQAVLQPISTKFVLGLEVGVRAFNMHIQGVLSLLMPKTDLYVRELKSIIKEVLPMRGRGFKIQLKPFSVGQTFSSMIGYCTKDQGKGHYQVRVHNVSPSVIQLQAYYQIVIFPRSYRQAANLMNTTEQPLTTIKEFCP